MSDATMKRQFLRPLTSQERAVAEQNHDLVFRFLHANRLQESEYYDVIIFRYLLTVENWFRRPDLYHYQFSTIAWHAMSSALHNDTKKKRRQIQTVSLDDMIPGCEDLTWGDVITENNLEYVPYCVSPKPLDAFSHMIHEEEHHCDGARFGTVKQ